MKNIKNEIQHIIFSNEQIGQRDNLKKTQTFLRRYAEASDGFEDQKFIKSEETTALIKFAEEFGLIYHNEILEDHFISAGAEQRVYQHDDCCVIKTNGSIFYEKWLDYFNNLLIHNYFFPTTKYEFLGFKLISNELFAVVKQDFVVTNESTNLLLVKEFLAFNGFENLRNNDYVSKSLGIIFEDLHDENVLCNNGVLFFIDTVFYLTESFYQ